MIYNDYQMIDFTIDYKYLVKAWVKIVWTFLFEWQQSSKVIFEGKIDILFLLNHIYI